MHFRNQAMALILAEIFLISTSAFWEKELQGGYWLTSIYFIFFTLGGYALAQNKGWLYRYIILCVGNLLLNLMVGGFWVDLQKEQQLEENQRKLKERRQYDLSRNRR